MYKQTEKNSEDLSLDELINLINHPQESNTNLPNKYLPPIHNPSSKTIFSQKNISYQPPIKLKTLVFKPWSGKFCHLIHELAQVERTEYLSNQILGTEPIKQEIDNEDEDIFLPISNQEKEKEEKGEQTEQCQEKTEVQRKQKINSTNQQEIQLTQYLYKFQNGKVRLIKELLEENGFKDLMTSEADPDHWTLYWSSSVIKSEVYEKLLPYQKINHFPNSFHLTRKDLMNKNISKMQCKYGISNFNFLPKTYILPQELSQLEKQFETTSKTTYIIKPHNRSQGRGITVTQSLETIYSKLEKYSSLVVSHYIENPLLINKLKFDLRIYVAVTGVNPLRIYVYDEGLARFATEEYEISEFCEANQLELKKFQHLTNYSINKKNTDFIKSNTDQEEYYGSKWALSALKDFLCYNIGKVETQEVFDRIDDVITKTILSGENILYTTHKNSVPYINSCFEVFGFDIMIDSNLKPWLIEVNMSPSMNTDSPLDLKIKANMIADLFTMIGISPIKDRYLDGAQTRTEARHFFKQNDQVNISKGATLNPIDKFILREVEAEIERSGSFRLVFPSSRNVRYKTFFEKDRYFNRLLRQRLILSHHNQLRAESVNVPYIRNSQKYYSRGTTKNTHTTLGERRGKQPLVNKYSSNVTNIQEERENKKKISVRINRSKKGMLWKNRQTSFGNKAYESNFMV